MREAVWPGGLKHNQNGDVSTVPDNYEQRSVERTFRRVQEPNGPSGKTARQARASRHRYSGGLAASADGRLWRGHR